MKNNFALYFCALGAVFSIAGCDGKTEVPIGVPATIPITVSVRGSGTALNFKENCNVDSLSAEFKQYKNNIGTVEVNEINYTITNQNGADDQVISTANMFISGTGADSTNKKLIGTINNVNLKAQLNVKQVFNVSTETKDYLVTLLKKEPPAYRVYLEGTTNKTTTNFKMKVEFKVKFKPKF